MADDQWCTLDFLFEEGSTMKFVAVFTECFSMIAGDDDDGLVH